MTTRMNNSTDLSTMPRPLVPRPRSIAIRPVTKPQRENRKYAFPCKYQGLNNAPAKTSNIGKSAPNPTWKVDIQSLKDSSTIFPIERTHIVIENIPAAVVADRVSRCLSENSIFATFHSDVPLVVALTPDNTRFEIRLFKHQSKCKKHGLLLEVQRKSGCAISFHWAAKSVLKAAKGISVKAEVPRPPLLPSSRLSPTNSKNTLQSEVLESIEHAESLLQKDRLDANVLGMESLRSLTSLQSTTSKTATIVSRLILVGGDGMSTIGEKIKSIVQNGYHSDDDECDVQRHFSKIIYNHALAVVANSLNIISKTKDIHVLESDAWFVEELLPLLLREALCQQRPHDACEAARCLNVLMGASPSCKQRAVNEGVLPSMLDMVKTGTCKHQRLEEELEKLSATLVTTV